MEMRVGSRVAISMVAVIVVSGAVLAEDPVILGGFSSCALRSKEAPATAPEQVKKGVICWNEGHYKAAHDLWLTAANNNDKVAQYNLGILLSGGSDIEQDQIKATEWFKKSAAQGYPYAQYNLGIRLSRGIGGKQDIRKALDYIFLAAQQGLPAAQYNLGMLYFQGNGLPKDIFRSYVWLTAAAKGGHTEAKEFLETFTWPLQPTQRYVAEYLADNIREIDLSSEGQ